MPERTVFILGASSDIGIDLMDRYLAKGCVVIGTYRSIGGLSRFQRHPDAHLVHLDLDDDSSFSAAIDLMASKQLTWDLFIAANGTMEPIGPFMSIDGLAWERSIGSNALAPCRLLQALYPYRHPGKINDVAFFAGGGTNNPFTNYSAYCLSKILLIKMCELLDDEVPDLKTFILGPGYIRTKIHRETQRAGALAGANLAKTMDFLKGDGTPLEDVFACIEWCVAQPREIAGGRNFSVVHDPWKSDPHRLAAELAADGGRYKLRRQSN